MRVVVSQSRRGGQSGTHQRRSTAGDGEQRFAGRRTGQGREGLIGSLVRSSRKGDWTKNSHCRGGGWKAESCGMPR